MVKPTDKQVKEVLEWCGCRQDEIDPSTWVCPDGVRYIRYEAPPTIDLTFLFKYAVPKLRNPFITMHWRENSWLVWEEGKPYQIGTAKSEDPALALFWVIYEVIKKEAI